MSARGRRLLAHPRPLHAARYSISRPLLFADAAIAFALPVVLQSLPGSLARMTAIGDRSVHDARVLTSSPSFCSLPFLASRRGSCGSGAADRRGASLTHQDIQLFGTRRHQRMLCLRVLCGFSVLREPVPFYFNDTVRLGCLFEGTCSFAANCSLFLASDRPRLCLPTGRRRAAWL